MSLIEAVALVVALAIVLVVALQLLAPESTIVQGVPRGLRVLALASVLVISSMIAREAWQDSGGFLFVLAGIPLACCLVALGADLAGRGVAVWTTVAAVVLLLWSLVTGLGLGFFFLLPAVLLWAAAAGSIVVSTTARPPPGR